MTRFTETKLAESDGPAISNLADEVHSCLLRGFTRTCFVIMPFKSEHDAVYEKAIQPALEAHGLSPIRTDKHVFTGNVVAAIRDGLRHCFFAIADTTGDRPNVMYELGMAHAGNKHVILLRRRSEGGAMDTPFDLQTESIIRYSDDLDELRRRLDDVIGTVCVGLGDLDDPKRRPA